ncbi:MAG: ThuA domain-containing protein [Lachnospiraceae bacterium]|nr:ThuA domain-containing protein [Lachnospiraceae bacterium]
MIRVTIWNEYEHERTIPAIAQVYPEGIHGALKAGLSTEEDLAVRCSTFQDPEQGLSEELLRDTDVLIWWSHARQDDIAAANTERVIRHVHSGMGLIALHSAHYSPVFRQLMGTPCTLGWKHGDQEKLFCVEPSHPIAAGVPHIIDLPEEELYCEPFSIPRPDDVVFLGWFAGGAVFRSGCTFTRGYGKIFYFQPGHEENRVYDDPGIRRILINAVRWAAPAVRLPKPEENFKIG